MNRIAAGVVAALVLATLTGCSLLFSRPDVSEEPLREQLSDVASVTGVHSSVDSESPGAGSPRPASAGGWPRVEDIVSRLAAFDIPQSNFVFHTEWYKAGAALHFGECAVIDDDSDDPAWASAELVAALVDAGIESSNRMAVGFREDGNP